MAEHVSKPKERVAEDTREAVEPPSMYRVLMHNDDYTTMDFVVLVLMNVFRKTSGEAHRIMLQIHLGGVGVCGVYPHEIAETKISRVHASARKHGYPLMCSMEPE